MADNKKQKSKPAGKEDSFEVTYTNFATNRERTELTVGEGKEFDNDALLKTLGFEEKDGALVIKAGPNEVKKDEKGNVVERKINGRTVTESKDEVR